MKAFPSPVDRLNLIGKIGATRTDQAIRHGRCPRYARDRYPTATDGPFPVIIVFYGGGWEEGERRDCLFVGSALAERGFTTVIPDCQVYPEVRFPRFVEDAASELRWTVDRIAEFGGNRRLYASVATPGAGSRRCRAFCAQTH